jgi:hypothetical protein
MPQSRLWCTQFINGTALSSVVSQKSQLPPFCICDIERDCQQVALTPVPDSNPGRGATLMPIWAQRYGFQPVASGGDCQMIMATAFGI